MESLGFHKVIQNAAQAAFFVSGAWVSEIG